MRKSSFRQTLHGRTIGRLIVAAFLFWVPVILFLRIAGEVLERQPIGLDTAILDWVHGVFQDSYDLIFLVLTTLGNAEILLPVTVFLAGYFWYKRRRLDATIILFSVGGAAAANLILKALFHRARPSFWQSIVVETDYSFPSGHAMLTAALALCLVLILWQTRWRWAALVSGAVLTLAICFSRLYFGVHYPTDIVAGWCVSTAWVVVVFMAAKELSYRHRTGRIVWRRGKKTKKEKALEK